MISNSRGFSGVALGLQCSNCSGFFWTLQFSGEDDQETAGLYAASACGQKIIAVIEFADDLLAEDGYPDPDIVTDFLADSTGLKSMRFARFLRVESDLPSAQGMAFQDFLRAYRRPKPIFSCICCSGGEAEVREEMDIESFIRSGGEVMVTGRLVHTGIA